MNAKDREAELRRVRQRIGWIIIEFWKARIGQTFYAHELRDYVIRRVGFIAPSTPDRALRAMRVDGIVNYEVVNRSKSLYRALPLGQAPQRDDLPDDTPPSQMDLL